MSLQGHSDLASAEIFLLFLYVISWSTLLEKVRFGRFTHSPWSHNNQTETHKLIMLQYPSDQYGLPSFDLLPFCSSAFPQGELRETYMAPTPFQTVLKCTSHEIEAGDINLWPPLNRFPSRKCVMWSKLKFSICILLFSILAWSRGRKMTVRQLAFSERHILVCPCPQKNWRT